ncbi:MAG: MFS transporter, partial [Pseudonocardia sp.]|nr:MFS transporter [Pseudonocardia sp.]
MTRTAASYRTVLRNAEFRAMIAAHALTMLAIIVADVSLAVLVYLRTGSPLLSAITFAVGFVPMGIGAVLFGGVGRDRPARDVLVATELAVAALVALMAIPGTPVPV